MPKQEKKQDTTDKGLKIISMPCDRGGCGWYRVRQPLEILKYHTSHDTHVIDSQKDNFWEIYQALKVSDINIIRPGGESGLAQMKLKYPEIKAKSVMDIDDNVSIISPYSEHYKDFGVEEYFDKFADKWIWKDGKSGFNLEENKHRVNSLLRGMRDADMVTVTTEKLREFALQYNKNVKVLPNCIDFRHWDKLDFKPNKQLRVGWSGGVSHYEDFYAVRKPLNDLIREFDFKLYLVGANFGGLIDKENRKNVITMPWVDFRAHSYRMMTLNLDISIIPLADLPFNHYKSAIKWFEMSAMGVPSVVSDILPYSKVIKNKETALGYKTPKQFYTGLKTLLTKPNIRKKIGYQARKWVKANRDAEKCVTMWLEAYKSLI